MKSSLVENPAWSKIDSTKIQSYMDCNRKYLLEHIFGWKSELPSVHLIFGQAWHKPMRRLLLDGYTDEAILLGWKEGNEVYRKSFPNSSSDKEREPKVPTRLPDLLTSYVTEHADDHFKTLYTEIGGTVPVDSRRILYFKMDSILEDERGYLSLEHKHTGRRDQRWDASWKLKFQIYAYLHALYCLFPQHQVYGVIVNGLVISKTKSPEFPRIPVRKTLRQMQAWLVEAASWLEDIERDMNKLADASDDEPELPAFKRNLNGCSNYFGCEYADICASIPNPLTLVGEKPPLGFKIEHWDPSTRELDTVKNIPEIPPVEVGKE
jgi:hypothetical protein